MSNTCRNVLKVRGPEDLVEAFRRTAAENTPDSSPFSFAAFVPQPPHVLNVPTSVGMFARRDGSPWRNAQRLAQALGLPEQADGTFDPEYVEAAVTSSGFEVDTFEFRLDAENTIIKIDPKTVTARAWRLAHWGVEREAEIVIHRDYMPELDYEFATVANPPLAFLEILRAAYPELKFSLRYYDAQEDLFGSVDERGYVAVAVKCPEVPIYDEHDPDGDGWSEAMDHYISVFDGHMDGG